MTQKLPANRLAHRVPHTLVAIALLLSFTYFSLFSPTHTTAHADGVAYIRVVHAAPDVGIVDVFADGQKILSSFQFASVSPYVPLSSGAHKVQVALLGQGINAAAMTQTISVTANETYTVAVIGTQATGHSFKIFNDNNTVSHDDAELRIYHLSPGTAAVDVDEQNNTIIPQLSYPQASNYISIPSGQHTFSLNDSSQNAQASFTTTLKPWTVTSIFAIGLLKGNPQLRFVTSQVQGIPALPQTGSDPNARPLSTPAPTSSLPWLVLTFVLLLIGAGILSWRHTKYAFAHTTQPSHTQQTSPGSSHNKRGVRP
jgi:hypothetical protein